MLGKWGSFYGSFGCNLPQGSVQVLCLLSIFVASPGIPCGCLVGLFSVWLLYFWDLHSVHVPQSPHLIRIISTGSLSNKKIRLFILSWEEVQPSPKAPGWMFCHKTGQFQPLHLTLSIFTGKTFKSLEASINLSRWVPRKASP